MHTETEALQQIIAPKEREAKPRQTKPAKPNSDVRSDKITQLKSGNSVPKKQRIESAPVTSPKPQTHSNHYLATSRVITEAEPEGSKTRPMITVENIKDRFDADLRDIPLDNPRRPAQEQRDELFADSLGLDLQLENLDDTSFSFDNSEVMLPIENDSEVEVVLSDETELDVFLPNPVESLQAETEYIGELLVDLIANFAESRQLDEQSPNSIQLQKDIDKDASIDAMNSRERELLSSFEEELEPFLSHLKPERIEIIKSSVVEIGAIIKISNLKIENLLSPSKGAVEQRLEVLCLQLFEALGLEYDTLTIEQFMRNIIVSNQGADYIESDALSIDRINSLGTNEHKLPINRPLITSLAKLIKQQMRSHLILGKYAIQRFQSGS